MAITKDAFLAVTQSPEAFSDSEKD